MNTGIFVDFRKTALTCPRLQSCVETTFSVLYTTFALCVSPNALCSISFSTSCSQSHVLSVTLKFRSADGEGHVRNVGRVLYRSNHRFAQSAANPRRQSRDCA